DDCALDSRSPDDRAADDLSQMVEKRVTAVLAGLQHTRVGLRAEREAVRPVDTGSEELLDRFRDVPRITLAVFAEGNRIVLRRLRDADEARVFPAMEDDHVLGRRQPAHRLVE